MSADEENTISFKPGLITVIDGRDQDLLDVLDILACLAKFGPVNATALTMIVTMRDAVEQRRRTM